MGGCKDLERSISELLGRPRRQPPQALSARARRLKERAAAIGFHLERGFSRGWELDRQGVCIECHNLDDVEAQIATLELYEKGASR